MNGHKGPSHKLLLLQQHKEKGSKQEGRRYITSHRGKYRPITSFTRLVIGPKTNRQPTRASSFLAYDQMESRHCFCSKLDQPSSTKSQTNASKSALLREVGHNKMTHRAIVILTWHRHCMDTKPITTSQRRCRDCFCSISTAVIAAFALKPVEVTHSHPISLH